MERKNLHQFLNETTYYTDPTTKKDFLDNGENLGTGFIFSFLGMLGLLNGAKNKTAIINHFRKDKQLRLANITDDNNNLSLIIKLLSDAGAFKTPKSVNEITRFMVLLRNGRVNSVDDTIIRAWTNELKPAWVLKNTNPKLRILFKEFSEGGSLHGLASRLFKIKNQYSKNIIDEFKEIALKSQFMPVANQTPIPGVDDDNTATPAVAVPSSATVGTSIPTQSTSVAPVANQAPIPSTPSSATGATKSPVITEPAVQNEPVENSIKIPPVEQIKRVLLLNFDFNSVKDTPTRMLLKLIRASILPLRGVKNDDQEYPSINDLNDDQFINSRKQILEACIIPALKSMNDPYELEEFLIKMTLGHSYKNPEVTKLERYFRDLILKHLGSTLKDKFFETVVLKDPIDWSGSTLNSVFGDSAIKRIFGGSTWPFVQGVLSKLSIRDQFTYVKNLYEMRAANDYNTHSSLIFHEVFEAYTKEIENLGKFPDNIYQFKVVLFADKNEIEPYVIRMKMAIERNIADGSKLRDNQKAHILKLAKSDIGEFSKLISKHFFNLLASGLDDDSIDPGDYYSMITLETLTFSKENFSEQLDLIDSKIKKPLDITRKAVLLNFIFKHTLLLDFDNFHEVKTALDQFYEKFEVSDSRDKSFLLGELFSRFSLYSKDVRRNKSHHDVMIEMMFYKDEKFPAKNAFSSNMENIESIAESGILNMISEDQEKRMMLSIMDNPDGYLARLFSRENVKKISKRDTKNMVKEFYFGMVLDNIKKDPDLVNRFYESMEPAFQAELRHRLIGANMVTNIIQKGPILPFDHISAKRLKELLSFNNIDIEAGLSQVKLPRKLKNQTISEYLVATKIVIDQIENSVLGKLKVEDDQLSETELTRKTVDIVQNTFAGKHGDIYPKILRSFSVLLPLDRYEEFSAEMERLGIQNEHIIPAFHGTGGIAAAMILRYGFKVISSTDPSVVGRMLGDGVYFAKNIDKSLQYVGNSGYGRTSGTKGYIFEMDAQLGKKGTHYKAAGLGSDAIRSPEWVVRDGNAQLRIMTAYEVEMIKGRDYRRILNSVIQESKVNRLSFKNFYMLNENLETSSKNNQQRFVFWDGNIPTMNGGILPFEKVKTLGKRDVKLEKTPNGPAVVFYGTDETAIHDIRFAAAMSTEARQFYFNLLSERQ